MKTEFVLGFICGLLLAIMPVLSWGQGPPLPSDVKIIPPDPNLPKELAAFSGRWGGEVPFQVRSREFERKIIVIIEEIYQKEAKVVYAWGKVKGWTGPGSGEGWKRSTGSIKSNTIVLEVPEMKSDVQLTIGKDLNSIEYTYYSGGTSSSFLKATLKRE